MYFAGTSVFLQMSVSLGCPAQRGLSSLQSGGGGETYFGTLHKVTPLPPPSNHCTYDSSSPGFSLFPPGVRLCSVSPVSSLCLLCLLDCFIPLTCPRPLLSRHCLMSYTCSPLFIVLSLVCCYIVVFFPSSCLSCCYRVCRLF